MAEFARGFRLHAGDGEVYDGAQFPSGHVVLDHGERGLLGAAVTLDDLPEVQGGARVEWPDNAAGAGDDAPA